MSPSKLTPRQQALQDLLLGNHPSRALAARLDALPADSDAPVTLSRATLMARLQEVAEGQRSGAELEVWARMVMAADDMVYEDDSVAVAQTLFSLAHPGRRETLPDDMLARWMIRLAAEMQPRPG